MLPPIWRAVGAFLYIALVVKVAKVVAWYFF